MIGKKNRIAPAPSAFIAARGEHARRGRGKHANLASNRRFMGGNQPN